MLYLDMLLFLSFILVAFVYKRAYVWLLFLSPFLSNVYRCSFDAFFEISIFFFLQSVCVCVCELSSYFSEHEMLLTVFRIKFFYLQKNFSFIQWQQLALAH